MIENLGARAVAPGGILAKHTMDEKLLLDRITLRLVAQSALQLAELTLRVIEAHGADLAAGAIIRSTASSGPQRSRVNATLSSVLIRTVARPRSRMSDTAASTTT